MRGGVRGDDRRIFADNRNPFRAIMGKKRIAIVAILSIICCRFILERNATRYGLPQPTPILSNYSHQIDYSANNFTRFVSYGLPRTASTTQFHLVCVCFFLHMKEHKPTLANETKCYFQGKSNFTFPSLDEPQGMCRFQRNIFLKRFIFYSPLSCLN